MRAHLAALALNTFRETVRDRIFYLVAIFGFIMLASTAVLSPLTVGAQAKIMSDVGLGAMVAFGLLVVVFVGSGMVRKEMDKGTIVTVLAKPVGRRTYLVGKFLGLNLTLTVMLAVMTVMFLLLLLVAPGAFSLRFLPVVWLCFLELTLVNAVAVFFSTCVSPVLAAVFTLGVFMVGHLSQSIRDFGQMQGGDFQRVVSDDRLLPDAQPRGLQPARRSGARRARCRRPTWALATLYGLGWTVVLLVLRGRRVRPSGAEVSRAGSGGRALRIATLLVAALAVFGSLRVMDREQVRSGGDERLYFPSGRFLVESSLGFRAEMADWLWFRFIQYYGAYKKGLNDLRYLDLLVDSVTRLDPQFIEAYHLASLINWSDFGRLDASYDILRKGILANPDNAALRFQVGFMHYVIDHDYQARRPLVRDGHALQRRGPARVPLRRLRPLPRRRRPGVAGPVGGPQTAQQEPPDAGAGREDDRQAEAQAGSARPLRAGLHRPDPRGLSVSETLALLPVPFALAGGRLAGRVLRQLLQRADPPAAPQPERGHAALGLPRLRPARGLVRQRAGAELAAAAGTLPRLRRGHQPPLPGDRTGRRRLRPGGRRGGSASRSRAWPRRSSCWCCWTSRSSTGST